MKGFLLDTDVVSIFAPGKPKPPANFGEWLERMDRDGRIFVPVVTLHEIERGITLLDDKGATAKAAALKVWLAGLMAAYADRILGLDAEAAVQSGRCEAVALACGHDPGMSDAIMAGIAKAHDLTVVSRNARHFHAFGGAFLLPEQAIDLM